MTPEEWDAVLAKFRRSTKALSLALPYSVYESVATVHAEVEAALLSAALRERESAKEVERLREALQHIASNAPSVRALGASAFARATLAAEKNDSGQGEQT